MDLKFSRCLSRIKLGQQFNLENIGRTEYWKLAIYIPTKKEEPKA
jgi:hypothetical protein